MKIGLFDSGVGGIKVLESLRQHFSCCDYVYLFDKNGLPYGNKSVLEIRNRAINACDFLIREKHVDAIVIACNTASCVALSECRKRYKIPIYGLIPPLKKLSLKYNKVLVLTTELTHNILLKTIKGLHNSKNLVLTPQKNLAIYIEKYATNKFMLKKYVEENLAKYKGIVDCVFLGCTHYYFIKNELKEILGCDIVDGRNALINKMQREIFNFIKNSHTDFYYL
ncbi:MAG: glutamate racemase [Clostridiales bacterium]|nr:glutamate racemase [Clostridiales bacterium]